MLHVSERKQLYRFLAQLFVYPDQDLLASLCRGEADVAARLIDLEAPPLFSQNNLLDDLETGFTHQFINRLGGVPAPPYGSLYLDQDGVLMGRSTQRVFEAYRSEGLSPDNSSEPPDYLATELEFLYYLVEQEEEALHRRDVEEARDKSLKQKMFISELLNPWVSIFCRRVEQDHAAHPLYRWGCRLLERFCSLEREWIERLH